MQKRKNIKLNKLNKKKKPNKYKELIFIWLNSLNSL